MSTPIFVSRTKIIADKPTRVAVVTCKKCSKEDDLTSSKGSMLPGEAVAEKFRQRGWLIQGHTRICPDCQKKEKSMHRRTPIGHTSHEKDFDHQLAAAASVSSQAAAVRSPSREDHQLIFMAVQESYPEPDKGYKLGATDDTVAAELGLPRVWVANIRDQFFGPALVVDPRIAGLEERYSSLLDRQRDILQGVATLTADLQQFRLDLNDLTKGKSP